MSIDRLERRLPDVLNELALPRVPDYVDTMLSRTERMPQRPGWTFPERWFPVSVITSAISPARRPTLRPLIAVAVVIALIVAAVALYVGSRKHLPPLFRLARNGIVGATADPRAEPVLRDRLPGRTADRVQPHPDDRRRPRRSDDREDRRHGHSR